MRILCDYFENCTTLCNPTAVSWDFLVKISELHKYVVRILDILVKTV